MATQTVNVAEKLTIKLNAYDQGYNYMSNYFYQAGLITIPDPDKITDIDYTGDICLYNSSNNSLAAEGGCLFASIYCCNPQSYTTTSGSKTVDYGFWGQLTVDNVIRFAKNNQLLLLIRASDVDDLWETDPAPDAQYAQHNAQIVFTYSDGSTKSIYLGSTLVNKIYLGSTEVKKVYICPSYTISGRTSSAGISRVGVDGSTYTVYSYTESTTFETGLTNITATSPMSNFPTDISYNSSTGSATVRIYSTIAKTSVSTKITAEKMLYSNS